MDAMRRFISPTSLQLRRPSKILQKQIRHRSYLSPPFLLDEYTPRYELISSIDASKKRSEAYAHLRNCNLCPRLCGVNRYEKTGVCLIGAETVKVGTIAPHFGEGRNPSTFKYLGIVPLILYRTMYSRTQWVRVSFLLWLQFKMRFLSESRHSTSAEWFRSHT
jgi:hypothetical protein